MPSTPHKISRLAHNASKADIVDTINDIIKHLVTVKGGPGVMVKDYKNNDGTREVHVNVLQQPSRTGPTEGDGGDVMVFQ